MDSMVDRRAEVVNGLRLRLEAAKTSYNIKERLALRAFLENLGTEPLVVLRRAAHVDLGLNATNSAGEFITSLLPPAPPPAPKAEDLVRLPSGGSLELQAWEMLERVNQQILEGNGRVGRFRCSATYSAGVGTTERITKLDPKAWVGTLSSNEVLIEVGTSGK